MNGKELLNLLLKNGFQIVSIKGSHHKLKHPDGRQTIIPIHSKKDLGKGLENAILKQAKLK